MSSHLEKERAEAVASSQTFPEDFQPTGGDSLCDWEVWQPARYFTTPPAMGAVFRLLIESHTILFQTFPTFRNDWFARKHPLSNLKKEEGPFRNDLPELRLPHSMRKSPKIGFRLYGYEIAKQEGEGK